MEFSKELLTQLANEKVIGDSHPFTTGDIEEVERYIQKISGRLQNNKRIVVEPDFSYYGSGFASYIPIRISKKDTSDSTFSIGKDWVAKTTHGLLLYISNLSPYWCFGASEWSETKRNGHVTGGSSGFLFPEDLYAYDEDF